ncbi:MAG: carbohydrate kinase family protein, partial [Oscillospiraceae bacterium]|nr:carbohydrate kinase family protein [Oscillospiraceae bacterium]
GMGAEGALMYLRSENRFIEMPAFRADAAVNTVGAGDALFAAFLNYYGKGFSPEDALERAQMFAAMKIRVSGAARGFSTEAEIEEALKNAKR